MRTDRPSKRVAVGVVLAATLGFAEIAMAGVAVPAPLAGALGPAGLLAAGAAIGTYFLVRKLRGPR